MKYLTIALIEIILIPRLIAMEEQFTIDVNYGMSCSHRSTIPFTPIPLPFGSACVENKFNTTEEKKEHFTLSISKEQKHTYRYSGRWEKRLSLENIKAKYSITLVRHRPVDYKPGMHVDLTMYITVGSEDDAFEATTRLDFNENNELVFPSLYVNTLIVTQGQRACPCEAWIHPFARASVGLKNDNRSN